MATHRSRAGRSIAPKLEDRRTMIYRETSPRSGVIFGSSHLRCDPRSRPSVYRHATERSEDWHRKRKDSRWRFQSFFFSPKRKMWDDADCFRDALFADGGRNARSSSPPKLEEPPCHDIPRNCAAKRRYLRRLAPSVRPPAAAEDKFHPQSPSAMPILACESSKPLTPQTPYPQKNTERRNPQAAPPLSSLMLVV